MYKTKKKPRELPEQLVWSLLYFILFIVGLDAAILLAKKVFG